MSQRSVAWPLRLAGVEVLVPAVDVRPAGAEEASTIEKAVDPYGKAEGAIIGGAKSVAGTINTLDTDSASPSSVEVEFGLSVGGEGKVVVVAGAAEPVLSVMVVYSPSRV